MNNLEFRVISFLIRQDFNDLKTFLPYLKKLKWNDQHKPIIDLLVNYINENDSTYAFLDLLISQYQDKGYLGQLLGADVIPMPVGKKEIKQLINQQAQAQITTELNALKGRPAGEVLKRVKNLKPPLPTQATKLADMRLKRIDDRLLEQAAPSTGFSELDDLIKGFVPGHNIVMTGETNTGKTQVACNFAFLVAQQGKRVLYFALEPGNNLIEYLASIWSNKPFTQLTDQDLIPLVDIDTYTKDDVPDLQAMIQIVEDSDRYDLIIIDHFGYFTTNDNKTQQESNAMKEMAALAKRKQTCILSIVHPNKAASQGKKRLLTMNDISGSAAFKQDATEVLLIIREKDDADQFGLTYGDYGHILVAKTKAGRAGAVAVRFIPNTGKIVQKSSMINQHIYDASP